MAHSLAFVLAPAAVLPGEDPAWADLLAAQQRGVGSGLALRMYRVPPHWAGTLEELVTSGMVDAGGGDPFPDPAGSPAEDPPPVTAASPSARRLICDAMVAHLEPKSLWLGVYELSGSEPETSSIRSLDRFPLREAENETCWFYPTDNGTYLCWENRRSLSLLPGFLPERTGQEEPIAYDRADVHVLWSLMADDEALTCVGLTYRRQRIDWSLVAAAPEPCATWTCFRVDTMAERSYQEIDSVTVFPRPEDP
jgi:hypothetical protein